MVIIEVALVNTITTISTSLGYGCIKTNYSSSSISVITLTFINFLSAKIVIQFRGRFHPAFKYITTTGSSDPPKKLLTQRSQLEGVVVSEARARG